MYRQTKHIRTCIFEHAGIPRSKRVMPQQRRAMQPQHIRYRAIVAVRARVRDRDIGLSCMCVNRSVQQRYVIDARTLNS